MGRTKQRETEFTVLDAIRLAIIPKKHRIPAIASLLITSGEGFPLPAIEAQRIASLLVSTAEEESLLIDEVLAEVSRQLQIKISRMDQRRKLKKTLAMGHRVDRATRINRVCQNLFGDPSKWMPVGRVTPKISEPYYTWFHRTSDGVLVASVDGSVFDDLVTGFVYYTKGCPVRFARLPSRARSIEELYVFLGLHPRLLENRTTKVDWGRRAFIVAGTNHLPWVYP